MRLIMGAEQCAPSPFTTLISSHFVPSSLSHPQFGPIIAYRNIRTNHTEVMRKDIFFPEEGELTKVERRLIHRIHRTYPNVLHIYHMEKGKGENVVCGIQEEHRLSIYGEYGERSLMEEVLNRRAEGRHFSQLEMEGMMTSLVQAIYLLHADEAYHGAISLQHIFLTRNNQLKMADKALLAQQQWQIDKDDGNFQLLMKKSALPSPIIFRCLGRRMVEIVNYDSKKEDVYAVGMVLLACCSLDNGQVYYNYEHYEVNFQLIQEHLRHLMGRYSYPFLFILERMLRDPDTVRPSAGDVMEMVRERLHPASSLPFVGSQSRAGLHK